MSLDSATNYMQNNMWKIVGICVLVILVLTAAIVGFSYLFPSEESSTVPTTDTQTEITP